jgi:hypothetical protein
MRYLRPEIIDSLIESGEGTKISIYLPMEVKGQDTKQNAIRFKNAINKVSEALEHSEDKQEMSNSLKEARELEDNENFWEQQMPGLVIFIDKGEVQIFGAREQFSDYVHVGSEYYLLPAFKSTNISQPYYLLDFSGQHAELYLLNEYNHQKVEEVDLPSGIEEITDRKEIIKSIQHKSTSDGQSAEFHGHGAGEEEITQFFKQYLQKINKGLMSYFSTSNEVHMIVNSTEDNVGDFKSNKDDRIAVIGEMHQSHWDSEIDMIKAAREIMYNHLEDKHANLIERVEEGQGDGSSALDLAEIVVKAKLGQVDTVMIAEGESVYGTVDWQLNSVDITNNEDDRELLDTAAKLTHKNGGKVHILASEKMAGKGDIAAILRY